MLNFYQKIQSFKNFKNFSLNSEYSELPDSWFVFVTDVKGSTKAIEEGRYKEVNIVGAASVTVCLNLLKGEDFPYVFGGDGATVCVPQKYEEAIGNELAKLRNFAKKNYNLDLRVAKIPVKKIYKADKKVLVAKYELIENRCIAFFKGGGLDYADFLAKNEYEKYKIEGDESLRDLEGVSCRWNPILPKNGVILSLIIKAKGPDLNIYSDIFKKLNLILSHNVNPVKLDEMTYKSFNQGIRDEKNMTKNIFSFKFLKRALEMFLCVLAFKYNKSPFFKHKKYAESMADHSDYRKFDDTLKMVVDCTEDQSSEIRNLLESNRDKVYFGSHKADCALMTCYVENVHADGGHIHFIDGGNGGYAMAAKELKKQISKSKG